VKINVNFVLKMFRKRNRVSSIGLPSLPLPISLPDPGGSSNLRALPPPPEQEPAAAVSQEVIESLFNVSDETTWTLDDAQSASELIAFVDINRQTNPSYVNEDANADAANNNPLPQLPEADDAEADLEYIPGMPLENFIRLQKTSSQCIMHGRAKNAKRSPSLKKEDEVFPYRYDSTLRAFVFRVGTPTFVTPLTIYAIHYSHHMQYMQ
jgi:hypothetical protein